MYSPCPPPPPHPFACGLRCSTVPQVNKQRTVIRSYDHMPVSRGPPDLTVPGVRLTNRLGVLIGSADLLAIFSAKTRGG